MSYLGSHQEMMIKTACYIATDLSIRENEFRTYGEIADETFRQLDEICQAGRLGLIHGSYEYDPEEWIDR